MATTAAAELGRALEKHPGITVRPQAPLAPLTTLRIGGPAELLVEVGDEGGLAECLRQVETAGVSFQLLGLGSNILIPDAGLAGVVGRLMGEFQEVRVEGTRVVAGAGVTLARLAARTARLGLAGLEAFSGFPSTVGGGVWMNAGCYGQEIKDVLVEASVVERDGRRHTMRVDDLEPGYRSTVLQSRSSIVTRAVFELQRGDSGESLAKIAELNSRRRASLPSGFPNAGSIFRNPPGDYAGRLIEACGLKGRRRGGAQISERHANVIVNTGGAKAVEVLELMLEAYHAVRDRFDIRLQPEVVLAGDLRPGWKRGIA